MLRLGRNGLDDRGLDGLGVRLVVEQLALEVVEVTFELGKLGALERAQAGFSLGLVCGYSFAENVLDLPAYGSDRLALSSRVVDVVDVGGGGSWSFSHTN